MNKLMILLASAAMCSVTPAFAQGFPNPHNPNIQTGGNGNGNNGCGNGNGGNSGTNCGNNGGGVITPPGGGNGGNGGNGGAGGAGGTGIGIGVGIAHANSTATSSASASSNQSQGQIQGQIANATGGNATGGNSSANNSNNSAVTVEGDSYRGRRIPVATAYAAPLAAGLSTCLGSASGGVQTGLVGISFGKTHTDNNCVMIQQVSMLNTLGLRDAAVQRACLDKDVRRSLASAGTPCESFIYRPAPVLPVEPETPKATSEEILKRGERG